MTETSEVEPRWVVLAPRYAHKFAGQTVASEPPAWVEPTDEAFAVCFKGCVWVPPHDAYPMIREFFLAEYGTFRNCLTAADFAKEALRRREQVQEQSVKPKLVKPKPVETVVVMLPGMEDAL